MRKRSPGVECALGHRTGRAGFGLRLPDCWDYILTHCTDVRYAVKEHRQFRMEKEMGAKERGPEKQTEDKLKKATREPLNIFNG